MYFSRISFPGFDSSTKRGDKYSDRRTDRNSVSSASSQSSSAVIPFSSTNQTPTMKTLMAIQNRNQTPVFRPHYFVSPDEHHKELGQHVEVLWKHNDITDLTVNLKDGNYACHKTVLSCYSKYFNDILLNAKNTVNVIELKVPSVTNVAFEVLLAYMYTAELHITCQNVGEVYTAARKLGIDRAVDQCTSILTGQTKPDVNSVYLYVMAWKQKQADRTKKALKVMMNKFEEIVGTPEFLDLDFPQVKTYLSQDVLSTRSEVIVYLAALKWLSFKYMEREQYANELMGCIRFPMMTLNELLACFSPPLLPGLLEMKSIREKLLNATCYVAAATVNEEKRFERYACLPRKYLLPRETVILWDPFVSDASVNVPPVKEKAAKAIQAAWRAYKERKSILEDSFEEIPEKKNGAYNSCSNSLAGEPIASTVLKSSTAKSPSQGSPSNESAADTPQEVPPVKTPENKNIDTRITQAHQAKPVQRDSPLDLDLFDFPKDKTDDSNARKTGSGTRPKPKLSFINNIRKSLATLMGNAANIVEKEEQHEDKRESSVENKDSAKPEQHKQNNPGSDVVSSSESLPDLGIRTDLRKYLCDSAQRSFSHPPETFHKIYTQIKPYKDQEKQDSIEIPEYEPPKDLDPSKNLEVYIIATGGFRSDIWQEDEEGKEMYLFDAVREKWMKYGNFKEGRHHHCIVTMGGAIYVIGGCSPDKTKNGRLIAEKVCYKLKTDSGEWTTIAKMGHCRMYHGVAALKGKIFAVGGKDEQDRILGSIEAYNPELDKWDFLASPLVTPMLGVGVCSHQRKIWIVGGMIQDDNGNVNVIKDVNCFDPETERWTQDMSPLPSSRAFAAVVSFGGHIYAIGGTTKSREPNNDQLTSISDVLYYEEKDNRWIFITPLPFPRHFVQTIVMGDNLYVMGGLTTFEKTTVDQVVCYSRATRSWSASSSMPVQLCGFAAAKIPASSLK